jgi:hypothetical protein
MAIFFEYSIFKKDGRPWEEIGVVEELWNFRGNWIGLAVRPPT